MTLQFNLNLFYLQKIHADDEEETTSVATDEAEGESTEAPSESSADEPNETEAPKDESPKDEEPKVEKTKKATCNPWPSDLKHPRDCCDIPHNPGSITLNTCFYRCSAREMDEQRQVDCAAGCFVNTTGILIDNRLNRERLKNMFVSGMFPNDRWLRVMEDAIDSCEFSTKGNLHKALAAFYACIHEYLADHCVNFIQSIDCEKTQELYEDCNQIRLNCDYWPRNLASPEYCCKIPPLFSTNLTATCRHLCNTKELFVQRQQKCIENCLFNDTKLRSDGKFNFNVVMEMLIESSGRSKEWRKSIETAVEKCKKALGGEFLLIFK